MLIEKMEIITEGSECEESKNVIIQRLMEESIEWIDIVESKVNFIF